MLALKLISLYKSALHHSGVTPLGFLVPWLCHVLHREDHRVNRFLDNSIITHVNYSKFVKQSSNSRISLVGSFNSNAVVRRVHTLGILEHTIGVCTISLALNENECTPLGKNTKGESYWYIQLNPMRLMTTFVGKQK